ncbi:MAG: glycosyltransferase family 2 protein [Candidatus Marinimicrobia bacterium]|nr:glycosyltransferase family 2 protein [Candidatus Neomarinimicrobiota bacterium]
MIHPVELVKENKNTSPNLSIIIVNFNGGEYILDCLKSIEETISERVEIIIADNNSTDGSLEKVRSNYPDITVLENKENVGFACANNIAVKHAKSDFILLLNPDAKLVTGISRGLQYIRSNKQIGVLGSKVVFPDGSQQYTMGLELHPLRLILSWLGLGRVLPLSIFRRVELDESRYLQEHTTDWVSGAFILTRKKVWDRLNGLDEDFFMYMEDTDFCRRVRDIGLKVVYFPHMVTIHDEGMGRESIEYTSLSRTFKSYLIYSRKYYGSIGCWQVRIGLTLVMLFRSILYFLFGILLIIRSGSRYREISSIYLKIIPFLFTKLSKQKIK